MEQDTIFQMLVLLAFCLLLAAVVFIALVLVFSLFVKREKPNPELWGNTYVQTVLVEDELMSLYDLKQALAKAIADEDFMYCAQIRDEINKRKGNE